MACSQAACRRNTVKELLMMKRQVSHSFHMYRQNNSKAASRVWISLISSFGFTRADVYKTALV